MEMSVSLRMFANFLALGQFDTLKSREHRGRTNSNKRLGMLVHTFNPCTHEAESGGSLSVQGHPGLYSFEGWGRQGTCAPSRSVEVIG